MPSLRHRHHRGVFLCAFDLPASRSRGRAVALKVSLYARCASSMAFVAWREVGLNRAELMRRLGWNRESVDRLFRLDHSRLDQLEARKRALSRKNSCAPRTRWPPASRADVPAGIGDIAFSREGRAAMQLKRLSPQSTFGAGAGVRRSMSTD